MPLLTRLYFNAVFGALGGLLGWALLGVLGFQRMEGALALMWGGALIGGAIGYFVTSVDAIRDQSLVRFAHYASFGLVLGALGGALGLLIGEQVHAAVIDWIGRDEGSFGYLILTTLARGIGWLFLGVAVGMSEGIVARSLGKLSYGATGGALGGLLGGAIFNIIRVIVKRSSGGEGGSVVTATAVGLVILGACIGALIALVRAVFQPASVKVVRGWQEGREYALDKPSTLVGRDEHADIALFRDMKIEKQHAFIQREGNRFTLMNNNAPPEATRVNGAPVAQSRDLEDGDRIELGQVVLRFQLRQAKPRPQKPARK